MTTQHARPSVNPKIAAFEPKLVPIIERFIDTSESNLEVRSALLTQLSQVGSKWWREYTSLIVPDLLIGGTKEDPYMRRWHLITRNNGVNIYLHQFLKDDEDRALHDHPANSLSLLLEGRLIEVDKENPQGTELFGNVIRYRPGEYAHMLKVVEQGFSFFSTGERYRNWGFHCPNKGFRHWSRFVDPATPGAIGIGCGEYGDPEIEKTASQPKFDVKYEIPAVTM